MLSYNFNIIYKLYTTKSQEGKLRGKYNLQIYCGKASYLRISCLISRSKRGLQITRVMSGKHSGEHTPLRTLMGYSSYACNCACTLPSPSPLHYVMAKIAPALQLAAHAKSNTLYGRSYGRKSKLFRLYGLLCSISYGLRFARCELRFYFIYLFMYSKF